MNNKFSLGSWVLGLGVACVFALPASAIVAQNACLSSSREKPCIGDSWEHCAATGTGVAACYGTKLKTCTASNNGVAICVGPNLTGCTISGKGQANCCGLKNPQVSPDNGPKSI